MQPDPAMRPRSLFWKLFLGNAAVLTVVLLASTLFLAGGFYRVTADELSRRLALNVRWLAIHAEDAAGRTDTSELHRLARQAADDPSLPLIIHFFDASGEVLAASIPWELDAQQVEATPELDQALKEGISESVRWSALTGREMKFVAARIGNAGAPLGVVRAAVKTEVLDARLQPARRLVWTVAVVAVLSVVFLALAFAQFWSRRIRRLTAAARRFSRGDLTARVDVSGTDETAVLARSLNELRDNLVRQLDTIDRQRRTLSSLVSQLREGVVVTGAEGRIVLVNPEARRLLQISSPRADGSFEGLTIEQCIPQHDLQELLRPTPGTGSDSQTTSMEPRSNIGVAGDQETRLQLDGPTGPISLLARACDVALPADQPNRGNEEASAPGRLLVLTDITELSRALQVKTDFAANASHELRTPLSAILAAIETIRSLDPQAESAAAQFLNVIERHSRRMQAMVVDLLDLSRLESPLARFEPSRLRTKDVFAEMQSIFSDDIDARSLNWHVEIDPACHEWHAHPDLVRIVLRNLLENAIRFTPPGGRIELSARRADGSVRLQVTDTGCGIPAAEQSRVFERFYQVERARSGPDRGTGLGLSIVRHAVAAMEGTVELQSTVGEGTRVTVSIPQAH